MDELEELTGGEEPASEGYSDEFSSFAASFLDPSLPEPERIEALKAAIQSCVDAKGGGGSSKKKPGAKDGAGLALVFGGGGKKKGD